MTSRLPGTRQLLILGLGLLAAATIVLSGQRTGATFASQASNPANQFNLGTVLLRNTLPSATACNSYASSVNSNSNGTCDTLINVAGRKPGDITQANVALANPGSLGATFELYGGPCTGTACGSVLITVQQCTAACTNSGTTPFPVTNAQTCWLGTSAANVCSFTPLATANTLTWFGANLTSASPLALGSLAAGSTAYFQVGMILAPSLTTNADQGQQAQLDLTWRLRSS